MTSMRNCKPVILLISSASPTKGPGVMTSNTYSAYKKAGFDVDLLTLYRCEEHPEYLYLYDPKKFLCRIKLFLLKKKADLIARFFALRNHHLVHPNSGYCFFYRYEEYPPVPVKDVLRRIDCHYDLVIINFWQGMLSFKTVDAIYEKLHCQFRFAFVDYSPMSGGCHFTNGCENYQTGCGCCPAFNSKSKSDFTARNVAFRERVYKKIQPTISGNTYMFSFFEKSYLLKNVKHWVLAYPRIDLNKFKPYDTQQAREEYALPSYKSFVILFGSQALDEERKGIKYMIESLNLFYDSLSQEERFRVIVVAIGHHFDKIKDKIKFDSIGLGMRPMEDLPKIYSMADLFLCSSVNDAGPMMVNQSLCCGVPVVGFEIGACLDAVKGKGTGYTVPIKDSQAFADAISKFYHLPESERLTMKKNCLVHAEQAYSSQVMVTRVIDAYEKHPDIVNGSDA